MNSKITIIIPIYKVEPYLHKCVDSVLAQTYTNLEVILIDDGSPDNCPAICDEYAAKDRRVKVIHQKNAGVSAARNAGLDAATGDYIGFVDSDDWIEPDMYETLYSLAEKTGVDVSVANLCRDTAESTGTPEKSDEYEIMSGPSALREVVSDGLGNGKIFCGVCTYLVNCSLLKSIRFPVDISNGEDRIFGIKLFYEAKEVAVQMYRCYHYCRRDNSATQKLGKASLMAVEADKLIFEWIKIHTPHLGVAAVTNGVRDCLLITHKFRRGKQFTKEVYDYIVSYVKYFCNCEEKPQINWKKKIHLIILQLGRFPYICFCKCLELMKK